MTEDNHKNECERSRAYKAGNIVGSIIGTIFVCGSAYLIYSAIRAFAQAIFVWGIGTVR